MPIKSYLAYPDLGRREAVAAALAAVPGCEVVRSTTHDVLVLVTDTADDAAETEMEQVLANVPGIQCLALVSGAEPELMEEVRR